MLLILGNGAIGNLLALQCHDLAGDYRVIARNQVPSEIHCQTQTSQNVLRPVYQSADTSIEHGIFVLPLKAYQIIPAIEQFKGQLAPQVPLVLLHNGMVNHELILQLLPNNPIIVATTSYGAFKPSYDRLSVTGIGATQAGWLRDSENNLYYQEVFEKLLPPCSWHSNILQILWRKLAVNCVINPLTAIHNITNGELVSDQYRSTIMAITDEIEKLMSKLNLPLKQYELFGNCMEIIGKTALNYSSMHQDVKNKRQTEIENINGYVVEQGKRLAVPTPINQSLYLQVKKIETYLKQ